jgi:hypothetical protein
LQRKKLQKENVSLVIKYVFDQHKKQCVSLSVIYVFAEKLRLRAKKITFARKRGFGPSTLPHSHSNARCACAKVIALK